MIEFPEAIVIAKQMDETFAEKNNQGHLGVIPHINLLSLETTPMKNSAKPQELHAGDVRER